MATEGLAVVTGGSRGIGRAVVAHLAASGRPVVAVGRDHDALDDLARTAARHGQLARGQQRQRRPAPCCSSGFAAALDQGEGRRCCLRTGQGVL